LLAVGVNVQAVLAIHDFLGDFWINARFDVRCNNLGDIAQRFFIDL
jgi:hypothetical protein